MRCQISSVKGVKNSKIVLVRGKLVGRKKKYELLQTQRSFKINGQGNPPFLKYIQSVFTPSQIF